MLAPETISRPLPFLVKSEAAEATPVSAKVLPETLTDERPKEPLRVTTFALETVREPAPATGAAMVTSRLWLRFSTEPAPRVIRPELLTTGAVSVALSPRVMLADESEPVPAMVAVPACSAKAPGVDTEAALRLPAVCVTLVALKAPERVVAPALENAPVAVREVAPKVPAPKETTAAEIGPAEVKVPAAVRLPVAAREPTVREPAELTAPPTVRALPDCVVRTPVAPTVREAADAAGMFKRLPWTSATPSVRAVEPAASRVAPAAMVVASATESALVTAKVPAVTLTLVKPTEPDRVEVPTLSFSRLPAPPTLLATVASTFWRMSEVPASRVRAAVPSEPPSTSLRPPPVTFVPPV